MAKQKFYVIWKGHKTGVFTSWNVCKKHIKDFKGAQYKSFVSKIEAEKALKGKYENFVGKNTKKEKLSEERRRRLDELDFVWKVK